ncbi:hypothetical protein GCM10023321_54310 [Pseudonocardia eucalypti]|uniref:Peptidase M10 metallopeptidase domain-containing protein n=1 Tax=Pseudonocardia eucalypti TaxID=648755 RepID=A0ABP9QPR2_9PSEU|nr:hypothetical protein [Pseudonocardia eucalypti]
MSRRLAELDRLDRENLLPAPPRNRLGGRAKLSVLLLALLIGGIVVVDTLHAGPRSPLDELLPTGMFQDRQPAAGSSGAHAFVAQLPNGRPVTYDPCQPIRYVINPAGMPPEAEQLVHESVRAIASASRLTFSYAGATDETPVADRPTRQPQRYGGGWAPVLIAWVDQAQLEAEVPRGESVPNADVEGRGGSTAVTPAGPELTRFVTGEILLSRQAMAHHLGRRGGAPIARAVIMHELGHVVGLDHVSDPRELMAPVNTGQTELGPGDRQGLAIAGAGACWR